MKQNNTVILAGGTELTNMEKIGMLEIAGYLVITANNLDYALAASELFKPQMLVIDADELDGDVGLICNTLINRPNPPSIYILSADKKTSINKSLPTERIEYLQKPVAISFLIERFRAPLSERPLRRHRKIGAALIAAVCIVAVAVTLMLLFGRPPADSHIIDNGQIPLAQQPLP